MIQTSIIPKNTSINIEIPKNYIGKKINVLFYADEEVNNTLVITVPQKKPSDFFGILTKKEAESFEKHITQIRDQWDSTI